MPWSHTFPAALAGKGAAALPSPFPCQPRHILVRSADEELKVEAASVLQRDGAGFLGAVDQGSEVDERGRGDAVLAEQSFGGHSHGDDGDGLPSIAEAGLNHLQPGEGLVRQQGGQPRCPLMPPHVPFNLPYLNPAVSMPPPEPDFQLYLRSIPNSFWKTAVYV